MKYASRCAAQMIHPISGFPGVSAQHTVNMRTLAIAGALLITGAVGQTAPSTWRLTFDYFNLDVKGHVIGRQRYSALYTRGLPGDTVRWNDVSIASADGWTEFGPAQKQDFMEGFSYPHAADNLKPEFFKGFPPAAINQRNLIWDTHMFESYALNLDKLKLNTVYHVPENGDAALAGMGTFHDRDLQLILTGNSLRNGRDCAVIDYRAMFNTLDVKLPGFEIVGRSDYWGQIWVSTATKQIEYATLYEEVLGEGTLLGQQKPMTISAVREGTFELVDQ